MNCARHTERENTVARWRNAKRSEPVSRTLDIQWNRRVYAIRKTENEFGSEKCMGGRCLFSLFPRSPAVRVAIYGPWTMMGGSSHEAHSRKWYLEVCCHRERRKHGELRASLRFISIPKNGSLPTHLPTPYHLIDKTVRTTANKKESYLV